MLRNIAFLIVLYATKGMFFRLFVGLSLGISWIGSRLSW
mgnify:CR=1 FL=1